MAELVVKETADLDQLLSQLPTGMREDAYAEALTAAGNIAKTRMRHLASIGDPNHNPQAKPLHKTFAVKVTDYQNGDVWVAIVGAEYPAGAHSHLVEEGHEVYRRGSKGDSARGQKRKPLTGKAKVEGKYFMATAIDQTEAQQDAMVRKIISRKAEEYSRG